MSMKKMVAFLKSGTNLAESPSGRSASKGSLNNLSNLTKSFSKKSKEELSEVYSVLTYSY